MGEDQLYPVECVQGVFSGYNPTELGSLSELLIRKGIPGSREPPRVTGGKGALRETTANSVPRPWHLQPISPPLIGVGWTGRTRPVQKGGGGSVFAQGRYLSGGVAGLSCQETKEGRLGGRA